MSAATQADGGTVARCSSCGAEIWFGLTVNRTADRHRRAARVRATA